MKTRKILLSIFAMVFAVAAAIASNRVAVDNFYGFNSLGECVLGSINQSGCATGTNTQCTVTIGTSTPSAYKDSNCATLAKKN